MGWSEIQVLQDQVCVLGQEAYRYGLQTEDFLDRLTHIENRLQVLSGIEDAYRSLLYRVDRYINFGEPLIE